MLTFSVKCASRLIEQDYLRVTYQGPCDGNSLLLAAGEFAAFLAADRVEAFGEQFGILNEGQSVRLPAGFAQPFLDLLFRTSGKVNSVANVLSNALREEDGFLLDESELVLVVPLGVKVLQIASRKEQSTISWVVEALDEGNDA